MECPTCKKQHNNPKFCSRSCAAKFTNRTPKRKLTNTCKDCSIKIRSSRARCTSCNQKWRDANLFQDMTLKEAIYEKHHKSSAFALVRSRARQVAKKLGLDTCQNCGYNKHVEIAHIKPISSFSEEIMLSVINSPDNIMALCPNCHWEFDHNL